MLQEEKEQIKHPYQKYRGRAGGGGKLYWNAQRHVCHWTCHCPMCTLGLINSRRPQGRLINYSLFQKSKMRLESWCPYYWIQPKSCSLIQKMTQERMRHDWFLRLFSRQVPPFCNTWWQWCRGQHIQTIQLERPKRIFLSLPTLTSSPKFKGTIHVEMHQTIVYLYLNNEIPQDTVQSYPVGQCVLSHIKNRWAGKREQLPGNQLLRMNGRNVVVEIKGLLEVCW